MEPKTKQTAIVIRRLIQDALDKFELPDGSFATEYVGDAYLDHLESRIAYNLHERTMDVRGKCIRDMKQTGCSKMVISFTDGTELRVSIDDDRKLNATFDSN